MFLFANILFAVAGFGGPGIDEAPPPAAGFVQHDGEVEIDNGAIRYGTAGDFDPDQKHKVGVLLSTEVYEAIPAYQTVKSEKIPPDSARYAQLMKQATRAYRAALTKVAKDNGYVLLVEQGGIRGYPVTEVTADVIAAF
ncbi:MAG TPA: hypothetical protein VGC54_07340 [Planctomycetota bacterium]